MGLDSSAPEDSWARKASKTNLPREACVTDSAHRGDPATHLTSDQRDSVTCARGSGSGKGYRARPARAILGERLFVGPRGGRIQTGGLRDATHWDEVVTKLGYEQLGRHDLRHTGLARVADAGVRLHRSSGSSAKPTPKSPAGACIRTIRPFAPTRSSGPDISAAILAPDLPRLPGLPVRRKHPPTQVRECFRVSG